MTAFAPEPLAASFAAALGLDAVEVADAGGTPRIDVPASAWLAALRHARTALGCDFFDWLSAVDEPAATPPAVDVVVHVASTPRSAPAPGWPTGGTRLARLLLRTRLDAGTPRLASATAVWAGAAWHERETHEMFGVDFDGFEDGTAEGLRPLLLPDGFEGTPLRKSFQLAARAAKAWPGAKEPGESEAAAPGRRKTLPPGVPDPATWGPRAPADPARAAPEPEVPEPDAPESGPSKPEAPDPAAPPDPRGERA